MTFTLQTILNFLQKEYAYTLLLSNRKRSKTVVYRTCTIHPGLENKCTSAFGKA